MTKLKKPKKKNKFKFLILFVVTFVATLFCISALFKNFSPPVDVNIGGEANVESAEENEHFAELDSRLKWIQYEDTMGESMAKSEASALGNASSNEESQKVEKTQRTESTSIRKTERVAPKKQSPSLAEPPVMQYSFDEVPLPVKTPKAISKPPVPTVAEVQNRAASTTSSTGSLTKVYIGFYPTMEQANIVRGRVSTALSGYQPFVRRLGSQYVVQVGSFSDRNRAVNLKSELDGKGFSARLLTE